MGEITNISWTDSTFNPWVGCQRVSPGCQHCYAEALDRRVGGGVITEKSAGVEMTYKALRWGPTAPRTRTTAANWKKPLQWNKRAEATGQRHLVFCASLADVFEDRPELTPWRLELFAMIQATPALTWLLLTKRPENIHRMLRPVAGVPDHVRVWLRDWQSGDYPPNVWLGTTAEDQQRADERLPSLLNLPAAVRFVSAEPLLERVDLSPYLDRKLIGWVIAGGESGAGARPFDLDWARDLKQQCADAGAAFFMKQKGANVHDMGRRLICVGKGDDIALFPKDLQVQAFPRAA